jgi:hypothetical protein
MGAEYFGTFSCIVCRQSLKLHWRTSVRTSVGGPADIRRRTIMTRTKYYLAAGNPPDIRRTTGECPPSVNEP